MVIKGNVRYWIGFRLWENVINDIIGIFVKKLNEGSILDNYILLMFNFFNLIIVYL